MAVSELVPGVNALVRARTAVAKLGRRTVNDVDAARVKGGLVSMLAWPGLARHVLAYRIVLVAPVTVLGRPIDAPVQRSADDE